MPELAPFDRFQRRFGALERRYLRALDREYRELRRHLLDVLEQAGLADPAFARILRNELDEFERLAAEIGRGLAPEALELVRAYYAALVRLARSLGLVSVDADVFTATLQPRQLQVITDGLARAPTEWVASVRATMLSELGRLRRVGEDEKVAQTRLLSVGIVDGRASAWRQGRNSVSLGAQLALWSAGMGAIGLAQTELKTQTGVSFEKQAIAAIDERTTECCLRAHGQVQPLDKPFKLTGTPRFADEVMSPPFHWYCRTGESLYHPAFEEVGVTTRAMRRAAIDELSARERTGRRVEIHPAHATSRR